MSTKRETKFNFTEKFKTRALELLDESNAKQFVEGLRVSSALTNVLEREQRRLKLKHGGDHERVKDVTAAHEASTAARATLFARYKDAVTPPPRTETGWSVDGFVRMPDGSPPPKVTIAACDRSGTQLGAFGTSTTDESGYFVLKAKKLPERSPKQVFIRASSGAKLLPSNIPELSPAEGKTDRVEIIIEKEQKPPHDININTKNEDTVLKPVPPVPAPTKDEANNANIKINTAAFVKAPVKRATVKKPDKPARSSKAKPPTKTVRKAKASAKTSPKTKKVTKAAKPPTKKTARKKSDK